MVPFREQSLAQFNEDDRKLFETVCGRVMNDTNAFLEIAEQLDKRSEAAWRDMRFGASSTLGRIADAYRFAAQALGANLLTVDEQERVTWRHGYKSNFSKRPTR